TPHKKTLYEIDHLHDRDLSTASHGEAYLSFFKSRMRLNQLILLDEPETPLSFENQLALMYLLKEGIDMNSQFIIATHSPVIMAFPNATIYQFTERGLEIVPYKSINQVQNLKSCLDEPNRFF